MKNVLLIPVTKSVQVKLELTATISTTDSAIQKKIFGSEERRTYHLRTYVSWITALIFSNEEKNEIIKIVKSIKKLWFIDKRCY